jgi:hypothetical protein
MGIKTDITFYTEATPNGLKFSIVLEELGLGYKVSTPLFSTSLGDTETSTLRVGSLARFV